MIDYKKTVSPKHDKSLHAYLYLIIGFICLIFSQGRWPLPLAALGYFIFMIYFFKQSNLKYRFITFVIVHSLGWNLAYSGLIPAPFVWKWLIAISFSLLIGALFLISNWVTQKSEKFYTTFFLPAGVVFLEYLIGVYGTGTGTSIAYSFSNHEVFIQLVSITGWTGVSFVVVWKALVTVWFIERLHIIKRFYWELTCFSLVLIGVFVYGSIRLSVPYKEETVRVASIIGKSTIPVEKELRKVVTNYLDAKELTSDEIYKARKYIKEVIHENFKLAENELKAGAKIIVFPEGNPAITAYEESFCNSRVVELTKKYNAYFGLGYYVFNEHSDLKKDKNKFVLIAPNGKKIWEYYKSKLVPGSSHKVGKGKLPVYHSEYGRLSAAICYDMDFPKLMNQAGKLKADIVFGPSNDWPAIRELHQRMSIMRAVEQGFSLIRPTEGGYTLVTDPYGRIMAFEDTSDPKGQIVIANVPIRGVVTIYSLIGDVFSWLCIIAFFTIIVHSFYIKNRAE